LSLTCAAAGGWLSLAALWPALALAVAFEPQASSRPDTRAARQPEGHWRKCPARPHTDALALPTLPV